MGKNLSITGIDEIEVNSIVEIRIPDIKNLETETFPK